jgi:hypothetical protein
VNLQLGANALTPTYQGNSDPEQRTEIYANLATKSVLSEYDRKLDRLELMLGRMTSRVRPLTSSNERGSLGRMHTESTYEVGRNKQQKRAV